MTNSEPFYCSPFQNLEIFNFMKRIDGADLRDLGSYGRLTPGILY